MIGDGDSNTFKKNLDVHPYPNIKVQKIECKNHLLRNYSKKIMDLVKDTSAGPLVLRKKIEVSTHLCCLNQNIDWLYFSKIKLG